MITGSMVLNSSNLWREIIFLDIYIYISWSWKARIGSRRRPFMEALISHAKRSPPAKRDAPNKCTSILCRLILLLLFLVIFSPSDDELQSNRGRTMRILFFNFLRPKWRHLVYSSKRTRAKITSFWTLFF